MCNINASRPTFSNRWRTSALRYSKSPKLLQHFVQMELTCSLHSKLSFTQGAAPGDVISARENSSKTTSKMSHRARNCARMAKYICTVM